MLLKYVYVNIIDLLTLLFDMTLMERGSFGVATLYMAVEAVHICKYRYFVEVNPHNKYTGCTPDGLKPITSK